MLCECTSTFPFVTSVAYISVVKLFYLFFTCLQDVLVMEERKLIQSDTQCQANAVEISNAVFAWDDAQNSNNNAVNSDEITCNFDDVESESKHGSQYSKLNQIEGREKTSVCQTKYGFESSHSAVQFKSGSHQKLDSRLDSDVNEPLTGSRVPVVNSDSNDASDGFTDVLHDIDLCIPKV